MPPCRSIEKPANRETHPHGIVTLHRSSSASQLRTEFGGPKGDTQEGTPSLAIKDKLGHKVTSGKAHAHLRTDDAKAAPVDTVNRTTFRR